ncbi:MAG: glycine dehydrogenase, partial [Dehalococcoidia bacterium]
RIASLPGYSTPGDRPFFKEFVVQCPRSPAEINRALLERRIIGGLDISDRTPNAMLLCVTEMNTGEEIDRLVEALAAAGGR